MTSVEDWLGADNTLGIDIWNKKYRQNNETFDQWLDRVSGGDKEVQRLILERKFLFGGRILSNRGTGKGTTSNCFVIETKDSIKEIYKTASDMAEVFKSGGGVGVDISSLAPSGAKVNNPAKTSSGAVSFVELFTATSGLIGQNGRRAALMVSISCEHPDVQDFIKLKTDVNKATTANLSIRVTDEFMRAVKEDKEWIMSFSRPETDDYIVRKAKAKDLFKLFCDANYDYGEPGLLFWDNIEKYNLLDKYTNFKFGGVNPCAEEPLPNGGACLLGSINLAEYVDELTRFKFDEFGKDVRTAIRALDTVQTEGIPYLPLEIQREVASDWKQLGLGIMGLGDMLIKMNLRYGSEMAKAICDEIGDCLAKNAIEESIILGKEKGNFPMFVPENTMNSLFYKIHQITDRDIEYMRNSQLLAIAPTGCQKGDTYVATSDGLLKLKEIVDVRGDTWQEINDLVATQDYQKNPISKGFINGYKPTKIITLENGLELECTHNHQYRVWRDGEYIWSRADELQTGDAIVSKIGYYDKTSPFVFKDIKLENYNNLSNVIKMPSMMNENLAFLIGAYYANGSNHYKGKDKKFHQIRFAMNANKFEDIAKIANIIYEQFGIEPGFSKGNSSGSATSIDVTSVNLANWLVANGIKKKYAIDNEIPFCIRTSRKEDILAFIQGYAFCDGSHSKNNVYIDTASKTMAQDLCIIMRAVGIDAKIYTNTKRTGAKSKNPMYRVYYNLSRSVGLEDKLVHVRKDIRLAHLDVKKSLGDGFVVDKIKSIQDSVCMTYDIEVENEHHYLANGVVSHNTISTMLGISGGLEPLYALEYERTTKSLHGADKSYKVVPKVVAEAFDKGKTNGLVCSADIDYKDRIEMQSVWQKHIDGSISSTINLPNDFPREKIYDIYMTAWEKGLKGVTVFRDGCKRAGVLNTKSKTEEDTDDELIGYRKKVITGCGPLWLNIFCDKEGNVKNTFSIKGSGGGCEKNMIGLSRMVSLALRKGIPLEDVLDQLDSCGVCPSYATQRAKGILVSPGSSCPSAMVNAIREVVAKAKGDKPELKKGNSPRCPECGAKLKAEGGCFSCPSCSWSRCN